MSALGQAAILLAAQAAWLACAGALASEIGPGPARFAAFLAGAACLALAGVLRAPCRGETIACGAGLVAGVALVPVLAASVAAGIAAAPAGTFGALPVGSQSIGSLQRDALPAAGMFQLAAVGALGPVCEEVLFRRLAFDVLRECGGSGIALAVSSLGFGAWHGFGGEALVAGAIGLLLGGLRIASHGIAVPIGTHAGLNLGLLLGGVPRDATPLCVGASAAMGGLAMALAVAIARRGAARG